MKILIAAGTEDHLSGPSVAEAFPEKDPGSASFLWKPEEWSSKVVDGEGYE